MPEPSATRPYMPGYGVVAADEGGGLLPWSWATERIRPERVFGLDGADFTGSPTRWVLDA